MEVRATEKTHARVVAAIRKLADYSHSHGLDDIHQSLVHAVQAVAAFSEDDTSGSEEFEEATWFSTMLEMLVAFCRRQGWDEVLDHLLEAKMAWDERDEEHPSGKIVTFRSHHR